MFSADPKARRDALQIAARQPAENFDPGFAARFSADRKAMVDFSNSDAGRTATIEAIKPFLKEFKDASGQDLPNWGEVGVNPELYSASMNAAKKQFDTWKTKNPDSKLAFPEPERIERTAGAYARGSRQNSLRMANQSTSISSALGGFAGTAVGAMQDPINLMTLGLGAGASAGVVKTALIEGGIAMGSEAAIQAGTFQRKQRVDPTFTGEEAMSEIAAAGVGGAVLGSAPKAIAAAWHKARTGAWPRHVRDAANVVTREASVPSSRIGKTAPASAAHRAAIVKASDDLAHNRPVELPPDLFVNAGARPGRVYSADGHSVGVEYQVVEADDLITSHGEGMVANPDFPPELQPRDRSRALSRDQVNAIAQNLQPDRLGPSPQADSGAPIVGPDGIVESGNGRVMALRQAYAEGGIPSDNYRNFLRSQGFDPGEFRNPVLIARRVTDLSEADRRGFVTAANQATALRLGAAEQAAADARFIDDAMLERLSGGEVDAASNRGFVQGFMQRLPRAEQGSLMDHQGVLSLEGERRIRGALLARAYDEPVFLGRAMEDIDSNIKTLAGALSDAAPAWVRMRDAVASGSVPRAMDVTDDVMDAMRLVMKARDDGVPVRNLINQPEMFGGPSEIGKIIARAMFNDDMTRGASRAKVAAFLTGMAEEARKNTADGRLFGEPLGAPDILKTALKKAEREDLLAAADARLTPDAIEKIRDSDEAVDAVIMAGERIRAQALDVREAGPTVDLGDGMGERSLSDILNEADDEITAAKMIEACAGGGDA